MNNLIKVPDINNLNPMQDLQELPNKINNYAKLQTKLTQEMTEAFALPPEFFENTHITATEIQKGLEMQDRRWKEIVNDFNRLWIADLLLSSLTATLKQTKGKARRKIRRQLRKLRKQVKND